MQLEEQFSPILHLQTTHQYFIQLSTLQYKADTAILEQAQQIGHQDDKGAKVSDV